VASRGHLRLSRRAALPGRTAANGQCRRVLGAIAVTHERERTAASVGCPRTHLLGTSCEPCHQLSGHAGRARSWCAQRAGLDQRVKVLPGETPGSPVADSRRRVRARRRSGMTSPAWRGASWRSAALRESCSVEKPGPATGHKREPNLSRNGEGHGRCLWSWSGHRRTLRRKGNGTSARPSSELGRASSARSLMRASEAVSAYNRRSREMADRREAVGGGRSSDDGRDNTTRSERRTPASSALGTEVRAGECRSG
jgi:hypothetical protein